MTAKDMLPKSLPGPKPEKRYKAVMIEDGSTIQTGWFHPRTARADMENHSHYHVLRYGKDYKIVRDYELEESDAKKAGAK